VDDPPAAVIAGIYRGMLLLAVPDRAVAELTAAAEAAAALGEPELNRLARAFRIVVQQTAGRRAGLAEEIRALSPPASDGYDDYILIWAAFVYALVDRDGPVLRGWMDRQADVLRSSGLRDSWVTLFCDALARIADDADYLPRLSQARRWAEAEGRRADRDCLLALAYAAACRGEAERAAELVGAIGSGLFHDTANFVHHLLIRDHVIRPMLDPDGFTAALARGADRPIAAVLAEHGL
jgi:hypothetical protein